MRKRLLISMVIVLMLPQVSARAASTSAPAIEDSTSPAPNIRYTKKPGAFKGCVARVAAIKGKPCDIIFIGDSITDRWSGPGKQIWDEKYAPRHALNFGVSADTTQNVLWRLENLDVKELRPKVTVILIGTNNTTDTPQVIADGVKAVISKTQSVFPGVKIILLSIMPNKRAEDKMMAANDIIKQDADNKTVYWLDLVPLMPAVTTTAADGKTDMNWKGLGSDHLHPDASGYQIWSDAMEPLLSRLLAGSPQ
jgi:lysophospholipase L1-like esterase